MKAQRDLTPDLRIQFSCVWILDSEERNYIQNFSEGGVVFVSLSFTPSLLRFR